MQIVTAEDEYKRSKELNKNEILKLLEWTRQQPHLPEITEREVILFHHSCYGSVEMTKRTIDYFYTFRTHCPEFFSNLDILGDDMKRMMKTVSIIPLKTTTPEGYKIILSKLKDPDPSNFVFSDCMKLYSMICELDAVQEGIQEGHLLVMDMSGCTLGHVARLNPLIIKKFLTYVQEAIPVRLKGLHYVNIVPFMDKILALMKPFMKKELMDMLHLHPTIEDFYEFAPKDILPKEYGGKTGTMESLEKEVYGNAIESREYFLNEEKTRRVNEKLRPGKPKNASDLFGAEGNFKKLDFD